MPRRPNTRSTLIYWLFDTRTNVPFYCGKTVYRVTERLSDHYYTARQFPRRKLSQKLMECGDSVRVEVIETVSPIDDWAARERYWIAALRQLNPDSANISDGGDGVPGMIISEERREKMRLAMAGRKMPAGHGEKIARKTRGQKRGPETLARMSASRKGEVRSQEQKDKIRVSIMRYRSTPEFIAKMNARSKERALAACDEAPKTKTSLKGRRRSPEAVAKTADWHRGKSRPPEWRAKMSAAQKGKSLSPKHLHAIRIGQQRRRERESAAKESKC